MICLVELRMLRNLMVKDPQNPFKLSNKRLCKYLFHRLRLLWLENYGLEAPWLKDAKNSFQNKTCIIVGNGPSLKNVSLKLLDRYTTFGTNGIFLTHVPNYYVTISKDFYKNHPNEIRSLKCAQKFLGDDLRDLHTNQPGETIIKSGWPQYGIKWNYQLPVPIKFSKNPHRLVHLGGTVLFVCLQIALYMGFSKAILVGVDHNFGFPLEDACYGGRRLTIDGEDNLHFSPNYSKPGYTPHCDVLATERAFALALQAFRGRGGEIYNATPNTGLKVVPLISINELK